MHWARVGCRYFATVFAVGFALGTVRVPLLVPQLGARTAELLEMPLMLLAIVWAARRARRRLVPDDRPAQRVAAGLLALALMVGTELAMVAIVFQRPLRSYLEERDPVAGAAYAAMLLLFAAMPLIVQRPSDPAPPPAKASSAPHTARAPRRPPPA